MSPAPPRTPKSPAATPLPFDPDDAAVEGSGIFGLPHSPEQAGVVVVPVPFEATTSYGGGTARAPRAVLAASRQVDLTDLETGRPWQAGIALLPVPRAIESLDRVARKAAAPVIAAGGRIDGKPALRRALEKVNAASATMNGWVEATVDRWLDAGKLVAVLGGDHSVPFGSIRAHARRHPGLGILHLDAHADLRVAYEGFEWSHASIFHNVATRIPEVATLVQVGIRDVGSAELAFIERSGGRIVPYTDPALAARTADGEPWSRIADEIVGRLPAEVYLSWDIDGLDPALCPHTGTPVPGGLSWHQATGLLAAVVRSGRRIVGLDLCEVAPGPRGDEWDANVGARLLYKMIGFALLSRR